MNLNKMLLIIKLAAKPHKNPFMCTHKLCSHALFPRACLNLMYAQSFSILILIYC